MLEEVLGKAKYAEFDIRGLICDKDSSTNTIFGYHFPECEILYCCNHSAKNLHKNLKNPSVR